MHCRKRRREWSNQLWKEYAGMAYVMSWAKGAHATMSAASTLQCRCLCGTMSAASKLRVWWLYAIMWATHSQQYHRIYATMLAALAQQHWWISRYAITLVAHTQQCPLANLCYNVDGSCMETTSLALYGNVSFLSALVAYMQRLWHRVHRCLPSALYQYIKMIKYQYRFYHVDLYQSYWSFR